MTALDELRRALKTAGLPGRVLDPITLYRPLNSYPDIVDDLKPAQRCPDHETETECAQRISFDPMRRVVDEVFCGSIAVGSGPRTESLGRVIHSQTRLGGSGKCDGSKWSEWR